MEHRYIRGWLTVQMKFNGFVVNGSTEIFLHVGSKPYSLIELKDCQWVDQPRLWEATVEFRSGRFFNCTRCSALAPAQKRFEEIQESNLLFFASWPERFYDLIQIKPYATD